MSLLCLGDSIPFPQNVNAERMLRSEDTKRKLPKPALRKVYEVEVGQTCDEMLKLMGQRPRPAEDAALDTSVSPCCASLTMDLPGSLRTWPQASSWITNSCAMDYRFPFPMVHAPGIDLACLFAPATYTIWPRVAPCAQFHPVNNDRCTILVSEIHKSQSNTGKLEVYAACTFRAGGASP